MRSRSHVPVVFGRDREFVLLRRWHTVTRILREPVGRRALLVGARRVAARVRRRAVRRRVPVCVLWHRIPGMWAQRGVTYETDAARKISNKYI